MASNVNVRCVLLLELRCDWHIAEKIVFLLGSGPYFIFLPVCSNVAALFVFLLGCSEFSGQFSEQLSDGGFTSPNGLMGLVFLLV